MAKILGKSYENHKAQVQENAKKIACFDPKFCHEPCDRSRTC